MDAEKASKVLRCTVGSLATDVDAAFAAAVRANHPDNNRMLHPSGDYHIYRPSKYNMAQLRQARDILLAAYTAAQGSDETQ